MTSLRPRAPVSSSAAPRRPAGAQARGEAQEAAEPRRNPSRSGGREPVAVPAPSGPPRRSRTRPPPDRRPPNAPRITAVRRFGPPVTPASANPAPPFPQARRAAAGPGALASCFPEACGRRYAAPPQARRRGPRRPGGAHARRPAGQPTARREVRAGPPRPGGRRPGRAGRPAARRAAPAAGPLDGGDPASHAVGAATVARCGSAATRSRASCCCSPPGGRRHLPRRGRRPRAVGAVAGARRRLCDRGRKP